MQSNLVCYILQFTSFTYSRGELTGAKILYEKVDYKFCDFLERTYECGQPNTDCKSDRS